MKKNETRAIVKYLKAKGVYDEVDDILIAELIFCKQLAEMARADIEERGATINVVRDPDKEPLYQPNGSVNNYFQASKQMSAIASKLGLTPSDRTKLKLESKDEEIDPFGHLTLSKQG